VSREKKFLPLFDSTILIFSNLHAKEQSGRGTRRTTHVAQRRSKVAAPCCEAKLHVSCGPIARPALEGCVQQFSAVEIDWIEHALLLLA
jgi:hypothetical protein